MVMPMTPSNPSSRRGRSCLEGKRYAGAMPLAI